jgi:hypothetical protein
MILVLNWTGVAHGKRPEKGEGGEFEKINNKENKFIFKFQRMKKNDLNVTWEDQKRICDFSVLVNRCEMEGMEIEKLTVGIAR